MSSSRIWDPSELICLGTRLVVLTTPKRPQGELYNNNSEAPKPSSPEGLLVLYQWKRPDCDAQPQQIVMEVGTNHQVYRSDLDWSRVRWNAPNKYTISDVLLHDGRDHPDITVRFEHSCDSGGGGGLELIMQQKLPSGLQKYIYKATLAPVHPEKSGILGFSHTLGVTVNDLVHQMESYKKDIADREQKLKYWKETATRLSTEVWQKEKDQLVHNFVKLWNERQRREKKQFRELQEELEHTKKELELRTSDKKRGRHLKLDDDIANGADDDLAGGHEPIPLDEVEALAAGRKLQPTKKVPIILKAEETISASALLEQEKAFERRKRAKMNAKTTGESGKGESTRETFGSTEAIDGNDGGGLPTTKITKKAAATSGRYSLSSSASSTDDEADLVQSPPNKRARPVPTLTTSKELSAASTPRKEHGDASSLAQGNSDDDDERLRAQILANVRKMKYTLSSSDED
jgi:hypothetical protein